MLKRAELVLTGFLSDNIPENHTASHSHHYSLEEKTITHRGATMLTVQLGVYFYHRYQQNPPAIT